MAKIVPNDLLNPTEKTIKNWNCSFIAVEGPNILDKLSLEDLAIPYESQYRSRIVLKAGDTDQPLIYGFIGKAVTFLMIKVTYDSENDPYYQYEQEKYNITYYFENDLILRPLNRLMVMTGSVDERIPQIYLNNPLGYDVVLDVLHATVDSEYSDSGSTYSATGISTTTLQQAYDNSFEPEILTNSILDGFTLRRGSNADTDNVLVIQNGAGTNTASIDGTGKAVVNKLIISGITQNTGLSNYILMDSTGRTYYQTLIEQIDFNLDVITGTTITIRDYSWYSYNITGVSFKTNSGTCSIDVKNNGISLTGMTAITGTTTNNLYYATAGYAIPVGNYIDITINSLTNCTKIYGSLKIIRT